MGKCITCDLSRIYKQFERKKNSVSKTVNEPNEIKTEQPINEEPVVIAVQEIKRVVKTKKKKVEPVETIDETVVVDENKTAEE